MKFPGLLSALLCAPAAFGQLCSAEGVVISIATGTVLTVEGDILLNTSATCANQGELRVAGDWTNASGGSVMTAASAGVVHLYDGPQTIDGTSVTDFRNLRISGGDKTLEQDAVVGLPGSATGTLDLDGATLLLNGRTFSVFNAAATAVVDNGGSVRSESVDLASRFQWALGADVGEHRIPFSTAAGTALPFAFTPVAPYAANTLLSVATYPTAPDNTPYAVTPNQQVLHIMGFEVVDNSPNTVDRFWLVDLPNGNFTGELLLSYTPPEDATMGPGPVRAQRWLESAGTWQPPLPGQSNPGLREALVPAVLFSESVNPVNEHIWAMAYANLPLPIELIAFDAIAVDNAHVHCLWTTASERDNDHFTVERSRDAVLFEEVGQVPGAGHSNTPLHYTFNDMRPYPGVSYYRLRQTDFDGTATWSQAVPVHFTTTVGVSVYPNPNNGAFTIHRQQADLPLSLQLTDGLGRLVHSWNMPQGVDRQSVQFDLASGAYTLRWDNEQLKLVISR